MSAIVGIGFEITAEQFIETGKKLEIYTNRINYRDRLVEALKERFSLNSLYILYIKRGGLSVFEKILTAAVPFSYIEYTNIICSKGFIEVRDFFDTDKKIDLCVFATDDVPQQYTVRQPL